MTTGNPNPNPYTIKNPYRTSYILKMYSSRYQFEKYRDKFPVELSKNRIVVKIQSGP